MKRVYAKQFAKWKLSIREYYEKTKKRYWVTDKRQWYWKKIWNEWKYIYWNEIY